MFKTKKARGQMRRRNESAGENRQDEIDNEEDVSSVIGDVRDMQKLRGKRPGINAETLATATDDKPKEVEEDDPYKIKTGGFTDIKRMLNDNQDKNENIEEKLKGQYTKEKALRDEDEEMRKFVENRIDSYKSFTELKAIEGTVYQSETQSTFISEPPSKRRMLPMSRAALEEKLFQDAAEKFKYHKNKRNDGLMSNQMLVGIPEVDLGMGTRMKAVEETEAAKLKLVKDANEKKRKFDDVLNFNQELLRNLGPNYVSHHRFDILPVTSIGSEETQAEKDEKLAKLSEKINPYETEHYQSFMKHYDSYRFINKAWKLRYAEKYAAEDAEKDLRKIRKDM